MSKAEWRERVLDARRRRSITERDAASAALAELVAALAGPGLTVCAHLPVGTEPGSVDIAETMTAAGARVLLPIAREPGPMEWAEFTSADDLVRAPYGLREPGGTRLGVGAITTASLILVPALAVDWSGVRLGRGAGFYDRTLPLARPQARLVAVVYDDEVVPELPGAPHDVRMTCVLTPRRGLRELGKERFDCDQ